MPLNAQRMTWFGDWSRLGCLDLVFGGFGGQVVAVEIDKKLIPILQEVLQSEQILPDIGDILALDWEQEILAFLRTHGTGL